MSTSVLGTEPSPPGRSFSSPTPSAPLPDLLDWAKGIGIVLVVLVHGLRGWFGWQGVHVFLVVSGFVLTYSRLSKSEPEPWGEWYRRRAERILPAYWIVATAGFLLMLGAALLAAVPLRDALATALPLFVRDVTLTRNASLDSMFGPVNAALWYVPLIAGLYLTFPLLYRLLNRARSASRVALLLLAVVGVEATYRAIAILWFDGMPVGFGQGTLRGLDVSVAPLDGIPAPASSFQLWAPFGWFPSRVAEFALGMVAAWAVQRYGDAEGALRRGRSLLAGLALWCGGNALIYAGRWGWVLADLLIAAGLTLTLLALASHLRPRQRTLRIFTKLGRWAYPLFLVHLLVGYAASQALRGFGIDTFAGFAVVFSLVLPSIWAASAALMWFDRTRIPHRMIAVLFRLFPRRGAYARRGSRIAVDA